MCERGPDVTGGRRAMFLRFCSSRCSSAVAIVLLPDADRPVNQIVTPCVRPSLERPPIRAAVPGHETGPAYTPNAHVQQARTPNAQSQGQPIAASIQPGP